MDIGSKVLNTYFRIYLFWSEKCQETEGHYSGNDIPVIVTDHHDEIYVFKVMLNENTLS